MPDLCTFLLPPSSFTITALFHARIQVVACLFAMVAQFYPMPFPDSRPLLGVCCAAYFTASSILQLIVTYIEKDCIMTTAPVLTESGAPTPDLAAGLVNSNQEPVENKTRAGGAVGLRIRTNFPRFSYDFTVAVQVLAQRSAFFASGIDFVLGCELCILA